MKTPLTRPYEEEIKRQTGAADLKDALQKVRDQAAGTDTVHPLVQDDESSALITPQDYERSFLAALNKISSEKPTTTVQTGILGGSRTSSVGSYSSSAATVARLLTLPRRLDDVGSAALYRQAYFAATLFQSDPANTAAVNL